MNQPISTLLIITLISPLLSAAQNEILIMDATQQQAFGIKSRAVQLVEQSMSRSYPAKVQVPNSQLQVVSSPLQGTVESLEVAEGQMVKKNQLLARVRSPGLLELQTSLLESRTRRLLSGETLARDQQLFKEGIIAKRRLLETRSIHKELLTAEQRDRQTLAISGMTETDIRKLEKEHKLTSMLDIRSPLSGVVLEQIVTAGQKLSISEPLYRIGNLSPLWIEIHVPLHALGNITTGSEVLLSKNNLKAKTITVGRMVHGTDQGVLVRAEISEGTENLHPGEFIEARLSSAIVSKALRIPNRAVLRIDGVDSVFVARNERFKVVPVNILSRETDDVLVTADLDSGASVVVSGTAALKAAFAAGAE